LAFERDLRNHMEMEERHILPLYEARVGHVVGGDPQFFYLEHKNLLRNLDLAKEGLRKLAGDPSAGRRQAHEFIQSESLLHHLLEHHDLREKNILYPCLDQALTPDERDRLLAACQERDADPGRGPDPGHA
jgi:hemerythrin-like domain-containing protein